MTEEKDSIDISEDGPIPDTFESGQEEPSEAVTELPQQIKIKAGICTDSELEKLKPVCTVAELNYQAVQEHIKKIREANRVLHKFHAREGDLTPKDVDRAKKEFHEAKKSYMQLGSQINEGIKLVHITAKSYPEDILLQDLYATYLAKLLSSLETRNEIEPYVNRLAGFTFVFDREDIILTEEEERRLMTVEKKRGEILANAVTRVDRLEARYQKRQLQNRLKTEERPIHIINQLIRISKQDPEDIHTYLWLASLMSQEMPKIRDPNRRLEMRDEILSTCQKAFALIDDFLNLQGIDALSDRDKRRSEYLKAITAIRKPLVER